MKTNEKIIKVIIAMLAIIMVISNFYNVKAEEGGTTGLTLKDMEDQASQFIDKGQKKAAEAGIKPEEIAKNFVGIGQILTMVGAGVLVAVTTYMGIKYLTSGPEAQAKLKVQLIGVVVSGMVIFGAYTIWSIVVDIASKF